jgi:hypothetical protein
MREVARESGVSLSTVQWWVCRAGKERLDRVDWEDRPRGRRRAVNRTSVKMEIAVVAVRKELKTRSVLGEYGAEAVRGALAERGEGASIPSVRTIGRILERHGLVDNRQRRRRPAPPTGWYLPEVAREQAELDSFDIIEGLSARGEGFEVLNVVSLHGGLVGFWPMPIMRAKTILPAMLEHWRKVGLPAYAQFDNDMRFQGPHNRPGLLGRILRACLALAVTPVFVVPRETGFQAAIENYNGQWQAKVWSRFTFRSLTDVQRQSARYVTAHRARRHPRIEGAPERRPFPQDWRLDLQLPPKGVIIFMRRTTATGAVTILERSSTVDPHWVHRLVRCELDLTHGRLRFYALRRRAPHDQRLLSQIPYHQQKRTFYE